MTSLNTFLRRADVEGMLQMKMDACDEKITKLRAEFDALPEEDKLTPGKSVSAMLLAQRIFDMEARKSAFSIAKSHLKFCEQFTLHDGHETNEAGIPELRRADGQMVKVLP